MGKNSKISWTHHTFNPWWGCTKIMSGCQHCYAEVLANRFGLAWGGQNLRLFGDKHWNEPLKWNREAERDGTRARVLCGSMCDVGELREGKAGKSQDEARERLWKLIEATPHLDWLLLTKRPHNLGELLPWKEPRRGVWIGASASTQADLDRVASELLRIPAAVRFLSLEPLLGEMKFGPYTLTMRPCPECEIEDAAGDQRGTISHQINCGWRRDRGDVGARGIDWVITGGESGQNARPCNVDWLRSIVRQCRDAGTACWVKQLGANSIDGDQPTQAVCDRCDGKGYHHGFGEDGHDPDWCSKCGGPGNSFHRLRDRAGADMAEWPDDMRVQQMPEVKP